MPRRRKSNLTYVSRNARSLRIARQQESSEDAEIRRIEQAERQANIRAAETLSQSHTRLRDMAEYNVVQATIITGSAKGETVLIPRIPIIPTNLPFQFKRLQFPLKVAFSISINKSQGQTLKVAGIHLGTPCFSHGQLYVGCSRVSTAKNLYIYAEKNKSRNIVYKDVLQ